jgi:hypothetical protein
VRGFFLFPHRHPVRAIQRLLADLDHDLVLQQQANGLRSPDVTAARPHDPHDFQEVGGRH